MASLWLKIVFIRMWLNYSFSFPLLKTNWNFICLKQLFSSFFLLFSGCSLFPLLICFCFLFFSCALSTLLGGYMRNMSLLLLFCIAIVLMWKPWRTWSFYKPSCYYYYYYLQSSPTLLDETAHFFGWWRQMIEVVLHYCSSSFWCGSHFMKDLNLTRFLCLSLYNRAYRWNQIVGMMTSSWLKLVLFGCGLTIRSISLIHVIIVIILMQKPLLWRA